VKRFAQWGAIIRKHAIPRALQSVGLECNGLLKENVFWYNLNLVPLRKRIGRVHRLTVPSLNPLSMGRYLDHNTHRSYVSEVLAKGQFNQASQALWHFAFERLQGWF
jgi:hypothetical protein